MPSEKVIPRLTIELDIVRVGDKDNIRPSLMQHHIETLVPDPFMNLGAVWRRSIG